MFDRLSLRCLCSSKWKSYLYLLPRIQWRILWRKNEPLLPSRKSLQKWRNLSTERSWVWNLKIFCISKTLKGQWTLLTSWLSGFGNNTNMIMPSYDDEIDRDKFLWLNEEFKTKTLRCSEKLNQIERTSSFRQREG